MGNFLNINPPSPESNWDYVYIYRASSESGDYTEIANQAISNLTYYDVNGDSTSWYKVRYYNSTTDTYSSYSSPIQARTETYTSMKSIARFLQIDDFSDSTKPSLNTIIDWIFEAEDYIDNQTNHSWRETTITNEYHDIPKRTLGGRERWWTGLPIYLKHRSIRSFDTSKGDKLEIWDGSNYTDWITEKTEGRANDFWVDYEDGIIYLKNLISWIWKRAVRVTYRYGETSIPEDIKQLATLLVIKNFLLFEDKSALITEGETQNLPYSGKIENIDKRINEILNRYKETIVTSF